MCVGALFASLAGGGDSQRAQKSTLEEARRDLSAGRPETRRSAVKKLAELGTREAFELVLGALADADGQVADEAQLAAGRAREPALLVLLQGPLGLSARDEWVRLRAAEAYGRVEAGFDPRRLFGGVVSREPELARTALWSIERQALAQRLGAEPARTALELEPWVRGSFDPKVRGAALLALRTIDAFAAHDRALEALTDRAEALRCAALLVVRTFPEQECLTLSTRALGDSSTRVRLAAIGNLEGLGSRAAALALIEQLGREPRARPKCEILRFLREASGADHGADLSAWRAWAETLKGPWSTGESRPREPMRGDTQVRLAGFELVSDRVTFLIDLSGSMWDTDVGGKTRKELVDVKLRACLESLPATAEFNVIPYTRDPDPFEPRLVRATKENTARAAKWFERRNQRGPGNVFDAIALALLDPEVDTLVVLTDGVPTGGRRWNMELMVELLVERNRFHQVAIDSILVDAPRGHRRTWAELAARTGGRSVALETADLREKPSAR